MAGVVVLIVVLATLYLLVFAAGKTTVQLGTPIAGGGGFVANVTSVSRPVSASNYRVNLVVDGTPGTPVPLTYAMTVLVSGDTYQVLWGDLDFNVQLTARDAFFVTQTSGPLPDGNYTLQIVWSDGSVVGSATYEVQGGGGTPPSVSFSAPNPSAIGFGFQVAAVSEALPASNFEVAFEVNATMSASQPLAASMTFTVGPDTYDVNWTDNAGDGLLNAGDSFDVTRTGGLPPGTDFTFHLMWSADGSTIAGVNYST